MDSTMRKLKLKIIGNVLEDIIIISFNYKQICYIKINVIHIHISK